VQWGLLTSRFPFPLELGSKMVGLAKDCPSLLAIHINGLKATFLIEENVMLSELKTIPEYETYEDYVESRAAVDLGVVPKDFFESIKKKRFQVWMINFGYYLDTLFKSPEEAEAAGKATGFEFKVEEYVR